MAFAGSSAGLTLDLVERLGRAVSLLSGRGRVFVGRDTRGSGPELEEALGEEGIRRRERDPRRGAADSRRGACRSRSRGGYLRLSQPTPVQRRQALRRGRPQADRRGRGGDRGASRRRPQREARRDRPRRRGDRQLSRTHRRAFRERSVRAFEIAVDCANGAYSGIAPKAFERLGAEVAPIAAAPDTGHQRQP